MLVIKSKSHFPLGLSIYSQGNRFISTAIGKFIIVAGLGTIDLRSRIRLVRIAPFESACRLPLVHCFTIAPREKSFDVRNLRF